jgi:DNA-binding GntR family transcriptional regulator
MIKLWLTMASTVRVKAVKIDSQSPEHPYEQLARQLREQIETGKITSQLPSITVLTEQTGLAVGTARRAINILVKEGLVQTVPGRGTFVTR